MSRVVELLCSRRVPQVAVLALVSIGFAGCSADMSTRLAQIDSHPQQSNHFGWQRDATGSVAAAPAAPVERRELPRYSRPQYQSQPLPPPISTPGSYPVASGVSGGRRDAHSYAPPARPVASTDAVAARDGWNHSGGTPIIVGTSDTLEGLSRRYGVSTAEILKANGYRGPRRLQPGQRLVIPKRAAAADNHAGPAEKPAAVAAAAPGVHYVNRGDTLMSIARHNHIPVADLARANGLQSSTKLKIGMKITVPSKTKTAAVAAQPVVAAAASPAAPTPAPAPAPAPAVHVAAAAPQGPVQKVNLAVATATPEAAVVKPAVKAAEATGALPRFRWPVRGRVIAAYGARTNGKSNDGINVSVPEGTPVKAAGDGVVAYAGNELKGYGNLILVRHPNGYVTAYAHASELLVKRGDTIKRGQVIAKSGQSGEAASPQLHFEIRKGSTPVDPLQFLSGA